MPKLYPVRTGAEAAVLQHRALAEEAADMSASHGEWVPDPQHSGPQRLYPAP